MENNKNKNDWFVASLSSPNNSLGDFAMEGLDNDNTQLLSREDYKKNEKIKETFQTEEGEFDENAFNTFYDITAQTYNSFSKDNYDKSVLNNSYFGESNVFVSPDVKRLTKPYSFNKRKNPFGDVQGIVGPLSKTESPFTIREIAQTQKYFDTASNTWKETSPNDLGFLSSGFGKDTLVLAQYDEDGSHYDSELGTDVEHFKGEFKFNDAGKPFYETLNKREVYGKDVLSPWDVLTIDGSMADKWNFMSSDDRKKSITGSIMKSAAYVAPYFIPGFGQYYTAMTLGNALLTDLLPTVTKAGMGLFLNDAGNNSELLKGMNSLQSLNRRWRPGVSDYAQQSIFNVENVTTMVSDVFGQLAQQRAIAKIPMWLGLQNKEAQAFSMAMKGKNAKQITQLSAEYKKIQDVNSKSAFLRQHFGSDAKIADMLSKWDMWSSNAGKWLGVSYMAGIASTQMHEEARTHGLDQRDAALMFLGSYAGMGALMQADFAQWALKGIGLDDLEKAMRVTIKEASAKTAPVAKKTLQFISKPGSKALEEATEEVIEKSPNWWFNTYQKVGNKVSNFLLKSDYNTIAEKAAAESLEEISEELLQDGIKGVYNGLKALNLTSTERGKAENFEFDDLISRYAMAGFGGAIGGAIAGVQDKIGGHVHSTLPKSLKNEMISMMIHGYENELREALTEAHRNGKLGSTTLSAVQEDVTVKLSEDPVFKPSSKDMMSQNDLVFEMLMSHVNFAKKVIFQEGDAQLEYANNYLQREDTLLDFNYTTPIQEDLNALVEKVLDQEAEISKIEGGIKEGTEKEKFDQQKAIAPFRNESNKLREEIKGILAGDMNLHYTKVGLFATQPLMYEAYKIKDTNTISQSLYKKEYTDLDETEKQRVDEVHADYISPDGGKKKQLLFAFKQFEKDSEIVNASLPQVQAYVNHKRALIDGTYDPDLVLSHLQAYTADARLDDVSQSTSLDVEANLRTELVTDEKQDVIQSYLDFFKKEKWINPELVAFIEKQFDQIVKPTYLKSEAGRTVSISDPSRILMDILENSFAKRGIYSDFNFLNSDLTPIYSKLGVIKIDNLNQLINNIDNIEQITGKTYENFVKDGVELDEGQIITPQQIGQGIEALKEALELFKQTYTTAGVQIDQDTETFISLDQGEVNQALVMADQYEELQKIKESKKVSPLHEMMSNLSALDGDESVKQLFETLNESFNDLTRNTSASEYIMREGVSKQHLEHAKFILGRVKAALIGATDFSSLNPDAESIIGFNSAINKVGKLDLPTMNQDDLNQAMIELSSTEIRIDYLLKLSDYNTGGNIREAKHSASRLMTLQIRALANYLEPLESAGMDMSDIRTMIENADQYQNNATLFLEETDTFIVPYDDVALNKLRLEKDLIEKSFYDKINQDSNKADIVKQIIDSISLNRASLEGQLVNTDLKNISKVQELAYVLQLVNVDPKQFYIDYYGDVTKKDSYLEQAPYSPFYAQEYAAKTAYWSVISKFKDVDTYSMMLDKILPVTDLEYSKRLKSNSNAEEYLSMRNSIMINGVPGGGKTTAIVKFLSRIFENYEGLNVAVFAPHQRQVDNIKKNLEIDKNYINPQKGTLDYLFKSISPELYNGIREALDGVVTNDESPDKLVYVKNSEKGNEELIKNNPKLPDSEKDRSTTIRLNQKNPLVAKFFEDFKTFKVDGKIPNVIVIDEATHIELPLLEMLNFAVSKHNELAESNKDKISNIFIGDTEQSGAEVNIGRESLISSLITSNLFSTPILGQSLRSGNNVISDNIKMLRVAFAHTAKTLETLDQAEAPTIDLKYSEADGKLVGHKLVDSFDLDELADLINENKGKVAIVTDKEDSVALNLAKSKFKEGEDYVYLNPKEIQGSEFDVVILDVLPKTNNYQLNKDNIYSFTMESQKIYTLLSRSRVATLVNSDLFRPNKIKINNSSEGVRVKQIALDQDIISKFKDFNIKSVKNSLERLKDSDQYTSLTKSKSFEPTKPTIITDDERIVLEAISNQLAQGFSEKGDTKLITDPISPTIEYDGENSLAYMYHERLGYEIKDDVITKVEDEGADVPLIYEILNNTSLKGAINPEKLKSARKTLKSLRLGVTSYLTNNLENEQDSLYNYLSDIQNTKPLFKDESGLLEDIDNFELRVMTKAYDHKFDMSAEIEEDPEIKKGGFISYLVYVNPETWNQETGDYGTKITLAALPNINNINIPSLVRAKLKKVHDSHTTEVKKYKSGKTFFKFNNNNAVQRVSNLVIDKLDQHMSYPEFLENHSHYNMSDPFVIIDESEMRNLYKENESFGDEQLVKITKGKNLNGKTAIFISDDMSIKPSELSSKFLEQVKDKDNSKNSIRMVVLNPIGNKFSTWLQRNQNILKKVTSDSAASQKEFRSLLNNYSAARMISRMLIISNQYHFNKDKPDAVTWIPESITHTYDNQGTRFPDKAKTEAFMDNIDKALDVILPAVTGMSGMQFIGHLDKKARKDAGVTEDTSITLSPAERANVMKRFNDLLRSEGNKSNGSKIRNLQEKVYGKNQWHAAQEHFIASEILKIVDDTNLKSTVAMSDGDLQSALDRIEIKSNDTDQVKAGMHNMVAAMRVAFYGGVVRMKDGAKTETIKTNFRTSGVDYTNTDNPVVIEDTLKLNKFLSQLDDIFTGREDGKPLNIVTGNKDVIYKSLFPDGVHMDIVLKKKNEKEPFNKVTPFHVNYGNSAEDLRVNARIQEPKLSIDLTALDISFKEAANPNKELNKEEQKNHEIQLTQLVDKFKNTSLSFAKYMQNETEVSKQLDNIAKTYKNLEMTLEDLGLETSEQLYEQLSNEAASLIEGDINKGVYTFENNGAWVINSINLKENKILGTEMSKYINDLVLKKWPHYSKLDFSKGITFNVLSDKRVQVGVKTDEKSQELFIFTLDSELEISNFENLWAPKPDTDVELDEKLNNFMKNVNDNVKTISGVDEFISSVKIANTKDSLTPIEQQNLSREYLKLRLQVKGNESLETELKDIFKTITDLKKC